LNGLFDSGNIAASATYTHTFTATGTFTYHCLVHSMMASATVVVTN
jgi:plastocyanin